MKKFSISVLILIIVIGGWIAVDAYRYFDIEKLPARAPKMVPENADNNAVLKQLMHGKKRNSS